MTARYFIGVDPGLDGAVVALDARGRVAWRETMPTLLAGSGGKRTLDTRSFCSLLFGRDEVGGGDIQPDDVIVALEELGARPAERMGASSAIAIGRNHGRIEGVLVALAVRYDLARPQTWQKALGLGSDGAPKQRAIAWCRRFLPDLELLATPKCRVPHDGLADAGALAEFARRHLGDVRRGR